MYSTPLNPPKNTCNINDAAWQVLCDRQQFEAALWDGAPDWAVDIRVSELGSLFWTNGVGLVESFEDGSGGAPGWFSELKVVATRFGHDWYDYKTQQMLSVPPVGTVVQALSVSWCGDHTVVGTNPHRPNEAIVVTPLGNPFSTSNIRPLDWDREFRPIIDAAVNVIRTCPSKQAEALAAALYNAGLLR